MPNIASLLKSEISHLSRREIRWAAASLKKASATHRRDIAALKRKIAALEKAAKVLTKRAAAPGGAAPSPSLEGSARFQARGLRSLRKRLGLSQVQLGKLAGVSGLTVYNWEAGKSTPRKQGLAAIVELRGLGKREVQARLEASKPARAATRRKSNVKRKK